MPATSSGRRAASAFAKMPPRLWPMIATGSPAFSASASRRTSSRRQAASEQLTLERMPARRVRYSWARSHEVSVARLPSPAKKPGISRTGRPSPGRTPSPLQTALRRRPAASKATRDSRHSGGRYGRSGSRGEGNRGRATPIRLVFTQMSGRPPRPSVQWLISEPVRAATIRDGSISVEEHPDPEPQAYEALVRVRAAGLNGADMLQLKGRYPAPPGAPQDIPGLELAGEVVAVGAGVERSDVGDRVMSIVAGGAQADLAVVHERLLMPVPDELDWDAAGATPEVFTT